VTSTDGLTRKFREPTSLLFFIVVKTNFQDRPSSTKRPDNKILIMRYQYLQSKVRIKITWSKRAMITSIPGETEVLAK
jgi:hypothetical protein